MRLLPIFLCLITAGLARAQRAELTIGEGWAAVREARPLVITNRDQTVVFTHVPPEADLTSLVVSAGRFPTRAVSWFRPATGENPAHRPANAEGDVVWSPGQKFSEPPRGDVVVGRLASDDLGPRDVTLAYLMTGLSWSVSYNVLVRGNLSNEAERLSVDLEGTVRVENRTARAFNNISLRVVGRDAQTLRPKRGEPGFLLVDEWLLDVLSPRGADEGITYRYAVSDAVDLPARGSIELPLVSALRKPADRLYRMDAAEFPTTARGSLPLRRIIVLPNDPAHGLGRDLPTGPARIFVGTSRTSLSREAWFLHTPASDSFRVDLGPAEGVTGSRQYLGRRDLELGAYEDTYSFQIANALDTPVKVEILDQPPTDLQWNIVSASGRWDASGGGIRMAADVEARGTATAKYTVRVRAPAF